MFTATAHLTLPSTVPGSWPRPRWFDVSMWGRPLDTCMMDVRFREKFQDALAVVVSDQERAGLDLLTHGDLHCDEDMAGRAPHHYPLQAGAGFDAQHPRHEGIAARAWPHSPLQRWAGFEGDHLQPEETRAPWLHYPPGTLLNEIYTALRLPRGVDQIEQRLSDDPKSCLINP